MENILMGGKYCFVGQRKMPGKSSIKKLINYLKKEKANSWTWIWSVLMASLLGWCSFAVSPLDHELFMEMRAVLESLTDRWEEIHNLWEGWILLYFFYYILLN